MVKSVDEKYFALLRYSERPATHLLGRQCTCNRCFETGLSTADEDYWVADPLEPKDTGDIEPEQLLCRFCHEYRMELLAVAQNVRYADRAFLQGLMHPDEQFSNTVVRLARFAREAGFRRRPRGALLYEACKILAWMCLGDKAYSYTWFMHTVCLALLAVEGMTFYELAPRLCHLFGQAPLPYMPPSQPQLLRSAFAIEVGNAASSDRLFAKTTFLGFYHSGTGPYSTFGNDDEQGFHISGMWTPTWGARPVSNGISLVRFNANNRDSKMPRGRDEDRWVVSAAVFALWLAVALEPAANVPVVLKELPLPEAAQDSDLWQRRLILDVPQRNFQG